MNNHHRHAGQGLLEAIIGIGVILAGTVGTITLVSSTIRAGRTSNNETVAASLAREGIEVARQIRDSNWLAIQDNVSGTTTFQGIFDETVPRHVQVPRFLINNNLMFLYSLSVGAGFSTNCSAALAYHCSIVFLTNAPNETYAQAQVGSPPRSRFRRLVYTHPICRRDADGNGVPEVGASADEKIVTTDGETCATGAGADYLMVGVKVVSLVCWDATDCLTAPGQKKIELEDRLYNWKYAQ